MHQRNETRVSAPDGRFTGALAALLMVGAIAFGATVVRPMTFDRERSTREGR